jgi:glycosyltransferase involved in cell wall biosynthesis
MKDLSKKIGWIEISSRKYGGVVYEEEAKKILAENFDLEIKKIDSKYFKRGYLRAPELLLKLLKLEGKKEIWIRNIHTALTLRFDQTRGKNLVIVHHIDFSQTPYPFKLIDFLIEKLIYHNLKKADFIVTVSQYWQNYFLERGYQKVYKIYNGFDLTNFNISEEEIQKFKEKYELEQKPIIYLGNCQKAKGVLESYEILKDLDCYLVTSGEPFIKIPARNLEIDYPDYLRLLKASSLVIAMSKFNEGWCRTVHEAMLLKTPVIGSGRGGMGELLEGGQQIICQDFSSLKEKVEYLLNHPEIRKEMGERGFNFAKNFSLKKFREDWLNLIKKIT